MSPLLKCGQDSQISLTEIGSADGDPAMPFELARWVEESVGINDEISSRQRRGDRSQHLKLELVIEQRVEQLHADANGMIAGTDPNEARNFP